jgi:adenosylcobinamide-GDP ribazoletransferase
MIARAWHAFVTAIQFLTRIPIPGGMNNAEPDRSLLRSAVVFFPLVGGLIGLLTGATIWTALYIWPPLVAALLALVMEAIVTGGFHEDAVADCCDGLGGGWKPEDVLRIMRDSRIGSFGALGLFLAVLLRATCLASLAPEQVIAATIASAGLGRWAILIVMATVNPVADHEGLARSLGQRIGLLQLGLGTLLVIPAVSWYGSIELYRCAIAIVVIMAAALIWASYVHRRIGGVTGDCLGFICYLAQLLVLLTVVARPGGS